MRKLIPEEARVRGYILLYADTPKSVETAVKAYNMQMLEWRKMVKRAKKCRNAIQVLTPFFWLYLMYFGVTGREGFDALSDYLLPDAQFWSFPVCIAVMAIFAPFYIWYGFLHDHILVVSLASAVLIAVKPYAALLFAADMVLYYLYWRSTNPIRRELEYPQFNTIDIKYQRFNKPDFDRKYI